MKKIFFLLIILFSITLYSQKREFLKGKLLYKNTNVPAANVINNSAQFATITDSNGEFEIPVLDGDEVIFSSVQYKIRTIKVTSEMIRKRRIIVSVNESITELDEVVVTPENTEILGVGKNNNSDVVLLKNLNNNFLLNTSSIGSYNGLEEKNFKKFIINYINFTLNQD